jgi:translation initiation factor IF-3
LPHAADRGPRVNGNIRAEKVLLLDHEKTNQGIVTLAEALARTEEAKKKTSLPLSLVEISPLTNPPVCWMVDYSKYSFQLKKKKALQRKNQKRVKLKEIKLRPGTDVNDYSIKLRHLISFLKENDRVKVSMRFRGREMAHQEIGEELLNRLINDIKPYGTVEVPPAKTEVRQRQMTMLVIPKKRGERSED